MAIAAGEYSGNPWIVTGAGSLQKSDKTAAHIVTIVWSGYTAGAADQVLISCRGLGTAFDLTLQGRADKTHLEVDFALPVAVRDISVRAISTGVLHFFLSNCL